MSRFDMLEEDRRDMADDPSVCCNPDCGAIEDILGGVCQTCGTCQRCRADAPLKTRTVYFSGIPNDYDQNVCEDCDEAEEEARDLAEAAARKRWRVEVQADRDDSWSGNAVVWPDKDSAMKAAQDLYRRWTLVRKWRVVETDEPANRPTWDEWQRRYDTSRHPDNG